MFVNGLPSEAVRSLGLTCAKASVGIFRVLKQIYLGMRKMAERKGFEPLRPFESFANFLYERFMPIQREWALEPIPCSGTPSTIPQSSVFLPFWFDASANLLFVLLRIHYELALYKQV